MYVRKQTNTLWSSFESQSSRIYCLLQSSRHSKLEKADILEMTVKHLRNLQRVQMSGKFSSESNHVEMRQPRHWSHFLLFQQRSRRTLRSWVNTEPDSTSAWTRSPASCPPLRGSTRKWGRGSSTTCPAAWVRWCPWTTPSRLRPSRRTWRSRSTCSSRPPCPSAVRPWPPSSAPPRPCPPKSSAASSSSLHPTDSSPFWSLTQPSAPPRHRSSRFTRTRGCPSRSTPARCTAARPPPPRLRSTAWPPSPGGHRRSARWGSARAQRAASRCGGPGSWETLKGICA